MAEIDSKLFYNFYIKCSFFLSEILLIIPQEFNFVSRLVVMQIYVQIKTMMSFSSDSSPARGGLVCNIIS